MTMTDETHTAVHDRERATLQSIYIGKETKAEVLDRDMIHPFQSLFL